MKENYTMLKTTVFSGNYGDTPLDAEDWNVLKSCGWQKSNNTLFCNKLLIRQMLRSLGKTVLPSTFCNIIKSQNAIMFYNVWFNANEVHVCLGCLNLFVPMNIAKLVVRNLKQENYYVRVV